MSGIFDQVINYAPPSLLKGTVTYKGTWSAATNTPTLINPPDSTTNGHYYVVSAAGTQFSLSFNIGDWIISNGSAWEKVDNTDAVSSVFGRTGAVVGVSTDYSSVGITATAVGASSPSTGAFTTLSATTPLAATSGGTGLSSLGTGVATFLGTPTSANLAAALTDETGSGSLVFGTSPTITTPVIAQINDANGNETLKLASIASAVNEVTIENAATGSAVHITATGGDASVGLHLAGKGASGYVNVQDSTDATKRIMFNAAGGTTNTRTMLSSTQTVDRTISLPDATDTLVGKATTDTLTNKTLTSPTMTAPVLGTPASGTVTNLTGTASININGTVGATTPSTIAATTATASGNVAIGAAGQALRTINLDVTASGTNDSAAMSIAKKGTGYATLSMVTQGRATGWDINYNFPATGDLSFTNLATSATVATLTSTGLAVTGALSATGNITTNGGSLLNNSASSHTFYQSTPTTGAQSFFDNLRVGSSFYFRTSASTGADTNPLIISSTGLAVTGTLSATGTITAPASNAAATFALDSSPSGALTVLNNATAYPFTNANNFSGLIIVNDVTNTGNIAVFASGGGAVYKLGGAAGMTVTSGTASSTNVYLTGNAITIENKTGTTSMYSIIALRTRAGN